MSDIANQEKLIAALRDPRRYPHAVKKVRVIETHISWMLLAGRYAYKIKKAVDLGFLNYSDLDARRICCEEEVRLNRRTAPGIYLDTVAIGGSSESPVFGAQAAIEYAVRMRRFTSNNLLSRLLKRGKLVPHHIDHLAAAIAHFHAGLPTVESVSPFGTDASIHAAAQQNFEQLNLLLTDESDRKSIATLMRASEDEFVASKSIFEERRKQGFVRECHGDLHLGNIALIGDEPVPFDGIEFNPALRWIDVMDEVAFTMMDLLHHNHPALAWRFLNAYLEAGGDYAGAAVLHFYLAYRAAVRAKVCAIRAGQSDISKRAKAHELDACRSYLVLAQQCLVPQQAALIITQGLPGSGKTTFSQYALERMGAIRIRSDVERKRLFGLSALESSSSNVGDIYGSEATARTYARLHELARKLLQAGYTVIVDAAFVRRDEREQFRALAQNLLLPFAIASLRAADTTLRERIRQRRNDASEADVTVLEKLQAVQQPLSVDELVWSVKFTTEEEPDSQMNSSSWNRLISMLTSA